MPKIVTLTLAQLDTLTLAQLDTLRRMWLEGYSASLIGDAIGIGRSLVFKKAQELELGPRELKYERPGSNNSVWTPERERQLEQLWGGGLSAAQIAARLGAGITRNAVIGKAGRMKLAPRRDREKYKDRSVPRVTIKKVRGETIKKVRGKTIVQRPQLRGRSLPPELIAPPSCAPVSLFNLADGKCRWPVGDLYCGAAVVSRRPYCSFHEHVSHDRSKDRKGDKPIAAMAHGTNWR